MSDSSNQGGGPAGWQPDPTGRHQYRYWDGSVWTDNVSDDGATSIDPFAPAPPAPQPPPAPTAPAPTTPTTSGPEPAAFPATEATPRGPATEGPQAGGGPPSGPAMGGPLAVPSKSTKRSKLPLILGAVIVVAALVVAAVLVFKDSDSGDKAGTFGLEIKSGKPATHKVSLAKNQVALLTATPKDKNLDLEIGIALDPNSTGANDLEKFFSDEFSESTDGFSDRSDVPGTIVGTSNDHGRGATEFNLIPAISSIDVTIAVDDISGATGNVDLKVEIVSLTDVKNANDLETKLCADKTFTSFAKTAGINGCDGSSSNASDRSS
jgi:Protein of unknown function (DUF2510)